MHIKTIMGKYSVFSWLDMAIAFKCFAIQAKSQLFKKFVLKNIENEKYQNIWFDPLNWFK